MYSVENNILKLKHIALHQIHKIMFFLASSYDPCNAFLEERTHTHTKCNDTYLSSDFLP